MRLNKSQLDLISKYLSDVSKILVASIVVGFFVQSNGGPVTISIFITGSLVAGITLWASVRMAR